MSRYVMDAGVEVAALHFILRTAERLDHDVTMIFAGVAQHPAAFLGSAVDDAWVFALDTMRDES